MKSTIKIIIVLFVAFTSKSFGQGNNKEFTEWPELKNFHMVMAQTFHPSEEGNYKPIRERSGELYAKAIKLNESKIPADLNKPEVKRALNQLTAGTKELDELVKKNVSDADLKKVLERTHESFHKIVGLCSKDDEKQEEHK
jgi:hypothetical protein